MKRFLIFILLSCAFIMCKSKSVMPTELLLSYVVVLENDTKPNDIKADISFKQVNAKEDERDENQWIVDYDEDPGKIKKIKAELLNHPKVLSVFTKAEYLKLKGKTGQSTKVGSLGKRKATKQ